MVNPYTVLVVDRDTNHIQQLQELFADLPYQILCCTSTKEALGFIRDHEIDIIIAETQMPEMSGIDFLRFVQDYDPMIECIMTSAAHTIESAVKAVKLGAYDFHPKPIDPIKLKRDLADIFELRAHRRNIGQLETEIQKSYEFHGIVGKNPLMLEIYELIQRLAKHFNTVLITGETGTGKEMVAQALHELSPQRDKPFVPCSCSALVENLLESELFGHVRGSFTGAVSDKQGLFEVADGGTIFLDEIGEISQRVQVKLLRVLQDRIIRRVGANDSNKVDVRVVAATNKDLQELTRTGTFREDLFYRLNVVEVNLPALRERMDDIPLLSRHFLKKFNKKFEKHIRGITRKAQILLMNYPWPGNIRELENILERAILMAQEDFITLKDLPQYLFSEQSLKDTNGIEREALTLEEMEKAHIKKIYEKNMNNKFQTAKDLGISRSTLYKKLEKYDLL